MWGITLRDRIPTLCLWSLDLRMGRLLDSCNSPSWLGLCARNRLHDTVNPFGTQQAQRTTRVGPFEGEELARGARDEPTRTHCQLGGRPERFPVPQPARDRDERVRWREQASAYRDEARGAQQQPVGHGHHMISVPQHLLRAIASLAVLSVLACLHVFHNVDGAVLGSGF